jgi:multiple sugar transport system permease protein
VLLVAVIIVYPILYTGWMSLQEWFASSLTAPRFIGLANYRKIALADARFQEAVGRTVYFTIVAVGAETLLGLAMALLFNREFWGRGLLRTLAILPMVATPTAIALVFVMMHHPSLGVANYLLSVVGLSPWRWTYSSQTALYALALVDVWQWTPLIMLIALAGLASPCPASRTRPPITTGPRRCGPSGTSRSRCSGRHWWWRSSSAPSTR